MPRSKKIDYDAIELELAKVFAITPVAEIVDGEPAAIVRAPLAMSPVGVSTFLSVEEIPRLEDLPFLSEKKRDFAYRYATEYKTKAQWAKEYGVTQQTVWKWLRDKGIRSVIAYARYEQRTYNMAQRVVLNRKVYATMNKLMDTRITADTIPSIVSMTKFVYGILNAPETVSQKDKNTVNVNVNTTPEVNPYTRESEGHKIQDVTPAQLEELRRDLEELDMIAKDFISDE